MSDMQTNFGDEEVRPDFLSRLKSLLVGRKPGEKRRRIQIIINPASGKKQPVLKTLNEAFQASDVEWDISITKESSDAYRFAREAVWEGYDAVAVYGGDGTVSEAAGGLVGSLTPLAILPGGTANVIAKEFRIPLDLEQACALAINPPVTIRSIDIGKIGDRYFLTKAGIGPPAFAIEDADREKKNRLGVLAYIFAGFQMISNPSVARYFLKLDDIEEEIEGVACLVANSGSTWLPGISLIPSINVSDGLLDVLLVRKVDLPALISITADMLSGNEKSPDLLHWQVSKVGIQSDPPLPVQADGEMIGNTPFTAEIVPQAVRIVVPGEDTHPDMTGNQDGIPANHEQP